MSCQMAHQMARRKTNQCMATMIAAPGSGQGKTMLTAALARRLVNQGERVQIFKLGPDYLDPTILEVASGQPVYNLDLWMMGQRHCKLLLAQASADNDIILVESLMGLHDNDPSNALLAKLFNLPITLVIDVAKFAQTAAAIVTGMARYGVGANITAVIGNRVGSDNHDRLMREAVGVLYAGSIRRDPRMALPERHLGLVQAQDIDDLNQQLDQAAQAITDFGITDSLQQVSLPHVELPASEEDAIPATLFSGRFSGQLSGKVIAIAQDAAFSFIYPANLNLLESLGAKLVYFSPIANQPLPPCDALWLPGGYPELHINTLTCADQTRAAIKLHQDANKPILAECGGMMYLCNTITNVDGISGSGCGLFDAHCHLQTRFQSVGLQSVDYGQGKINGHSFHHSKLVTSVSPVRYGLKQHVNQGEGEQGEAVYSHGKTIMTYVHHYFASNPAAVAAIFG